MKLLERQGWHMNFEDKINWIVDNKEDVDEYADYLDRLESYRDELIQAQIDDMAEAQGGYNG